MAIAPPQFNCRERPRGRRGDATPKSLAFEAVSLLLPPLTTIVSIPSVVRIEARVAGKNDASSRVGITIDSSGRFVSLWVFRANRAAEQTGKIFRPIDISQRARAKRFSMRFSRRSDRGGQGTSLSTACPTPNGNNSVAACFRASEKIVAAIDAGPSTTSVSATDRTPGERSVSSARAIAADEHDAFGAVAKASRSPPRAVSQCDSLAAWNSEKRLDSPGHRRFIAAVEIHVDFDVATAAKVLCPSERALRQVAMRRGGPFGAERRDQPRFDSARLGIAREDEQPAA